jgi:hypothetical protein
MLRWLCPRCEVQQEEPLWTVPRLSTGYRAQLDASARRVLPAGARVEPPEQFSREVLMQKRGSPGRRWKRGGYFVAPGSCDLGRTLAGSIGATVRAHASMTHTRRDQARQSLI